MAKCVLVWLKGVTQQDDISMSGVSWPLTLA